MHKIGESVGFSGGILGPSLKTGLPLIGSLLKPLANRVLLQFGLTAAATSTDAAVLKKLFGSGRHPSDFWSSSRTNTLIILTKETNDIMKINNPLKESGCNETRTHNHLVRKQTLNHLAKCLSIRLQTRWFWVRVSLHSLKLQISRLLRARSSLEFRQL